MVLLKHKCITSKRRKEKKEGNISFNDTLNLFYILQLFGVQLIHLLSKMQNVQINILLYSSS